MKLRLKQSIGLFDESSRVIRLVKLRGKIIQTMGCYFAPNHKNLLCRLHLEDPPLFVHGRSSVRSFLDLFNASLRFLVDQGYLVLFRETNPSTYHSLLSLQEAMECMVAFHSAINHKRTPFLLDRWRHSFGSLFDLFRFEKIRTCGIQVQISPLLPLFNS